MNEYHTSGPYAGRRKSETQIRIERTQHIQELEQAVEESKSCKAIIGAPLTCYGKHGLAIISNLTTTIIASSLAYNASEITKDPDANSALYGICVPVAMIGATATLYNTVKYLCCGTKMNEATATNQNVSTRQHV